MFSWKIKLLIVSLKGLVVEMDSDSKIKLWILYVTSHKILFITRSIILQFFILNLLIYPLFFPTFFSFLLTFYLELI
jgi:hypothetical protein